jgi:hypothetical protein
VSSWAPVLAVGLAVAGAVYVTERVLQRAPAPERVEVRTVYQDRVLPGVGPTVYRTLTNYVTNRAELSNLVARMQELDRFRTAPGWIAATNNRLWAGVGPRWWSAEYDISPPSNIVGGYAGTGAGAFYLRRLGRWYVGGIAGAASGQAQVNLAGGVSF